MNKELRDKIIKINNSGDFENQINTLSLEEKAEIILSTHILANLFCETCESKNIILLNKDEYQQALEIYPSLSFAIANSHTGIVRIPDDELMSTIDQFNQKDLLQLVEDKTILEDYIANLPDDEITYHSFPFLDKISDEEIEKMILDPRNQSEIKFEYLINSFKTDKYRIKYIEKLSDYEKIRQISKIEDDSIKEKYLSIFTSGKDTIISSFKSDELKMKYVKKYKFVLSSSSKAFILSTLKNKSLVRKNIKLFSKTKDLIEIATSLYSSDRSFYGEILSNVNGDLNIRKIFKSISSDLLGEELEQKLVSKVSTQIVLSDIFYDLSDKAKEKVLPRISEKNIEKYVRDTMGSRIISKIFLYLKNDDFLYEALDHSLIIEKYTDDLLPLFEKVSNKYGLNVNHLVSLAKLTNCGILNQVKNNNIKKAINLSDDDFEKYLEIISKKKQNIDIVKINTVLVSCLNKKFSLEFPDIVTINANTIHDIADHNYEAAINKINEVCSLANPESEKLTYEELIRGVLEENENIMEIYRKLTNKYLIEKRNEYIKLFMDKALYSCTETEFEKNGILKCFFNSMPTEDLIEMICNRIKNYYTYQELNNPELLREIIEFKKGNIPFQSISDEAKKNIKILENFCYSKYTIINRDYYSYEALIEKAPEISLVHSIRKEGIELSIFEIISKIDVERLKEKIFADEELYESMLKYIERYGMIGWNDCFDDISSEVDISLNAETVAALISNYDLIVKESIEKQKKGKEVNFMSEMAFAECLYSKSNIYRYLLGDAISKILARNPQPNSSPLSKTNILEKAVPLLVKMQKRDSITVPPIDETVTLESGKKLNCILGTTNDPINLVFGESTGSCMRIGGAGETLFEFCLLNENGFHISFTDPDTNQLVSRVSGFRNGNTVFLNQLRHPIGNKYSDADIKEACRLISERIIELTKESEYPIENVVASNSYVLEKEKTVPLNIKDPRDGLPYFYTDVRTSAVVIATANNGELLPIKQKPNNVERYKPTRMKVKKSNQEESEVDTIHIEALDQLYSGKNIDEIEIVEKNNISYSYVGEDWYIIVQSNGNIVRYLQENSKDKNKAVEEMNKYISLVERESKNTMSSANGNSNIKELEAENERTR